MKILKKYACMAFVLLLASCGKENDYRNALPEQSAAVVSLDLPKLASRAGLDGKDGNDGLTRLKTMVKSGLEGSGQLVDRIFTDASESGIDFTQKLFFFSNEENAILGLLAKVASSDKLEKVLGALEKEQLCAPVRDTEGCKWTVLGKWLIAYSDHALLVIADNKWADPAKLSRQASMWLRQENGQGFAAKSDFQALQMAQADISIWSSLHLLPRKTLTPFTMGLSAEIDLKKIKSVTSINFEDGKLIADIHPLVSDPIMKQIMDKKQSSMGTIKGDYLDMFPSKTEFCTTANIKGSQFYEFLRGIPAVRKFFDYSDLPITLDYGRILNAIEGDVFFAIIDARRTQFIFYADVKQTEFLEYFSELRPIIAKSNGMLKLDEYSKDAYCFAVRDGSIMNLHPGPKMFWLGVKDGHFYLTNHEELLNQRVLGLSLRSKEWGKRVPGQMFLLSSNWIGMAAFEYLLQKEVLKNLPEDVFKLSNGMTIESSDGKHIRVEIELKDKKQNIMRTLLNR